MRQFEGKVLKRCHGKSYVVVNHSQGGGVINHVTVAENETSLDSVERAEAKRLAEAMRKKDRWSRTEFIGDEIEVMEVHCK